MGVIGMIGMQQTNGLSQSIELLLHGNACVNAETILGYSPLDMLAFFAGDDKVASLLIGRRADVNHRMTARTPKGKLFLKIFHIEGHLGSQYARSQSALGRVIRGAD